MNLSELQLDALTEVFNIGVGQAADALSQIAGESVVLSVPRVQLVDRAALAQELVSTGCQRLCAVRQGFSGIITTDAMLIFPVDQSLLLVQMMVGGDVPLEQLGEMEQDALAEIGNIVLNCVFGSVADALHMQFDGSLPRVEQGSASDIVGIGGIAERVLSMEVAFGLEAHDIRGHIALMLDVKAMNELGVRLAEFLSGALA